MPTTSRQVITHVKGKNPKGTSEKQAKGYAPYLSTGYLRNEEKPQYAKISDDTILVNDGDVILLWDGSNAGEVFLGKAGILSSTMARLLTKAKAVDARFLFYLLKSKEGYLQSLTRGTGIPHVDKTVFENLFFTLPPMSEQLEISKILSTVDGAIKKTNEVIAKTGRLKKGLMQELLTKGIGHNEFKESEIGRIPKEWEIEQLDGLCEAIVDCPHSTPKFTDKGVPIIRNFNIRDANLVLDEIYYTTEEEWFSRTRRLVPQKDDVLFSREAPIGEACLAPSFRFSLGQRLMLMRCNQRLLLPHFLVYIFYSPPIRGRFARLQTGMTAHHVNVEEMRKLRVPLPSLDEQLKIVSVIQSAEENLGLERGERLRLGRTKQGLMDLLLNGKVRVRVD